MNQESSRIFSDEGASFHGTNLPKILFDIGHALSLVRTKFLTNIGRYAADVKRQWPARVSALVLDAQFFEAF